jgi:hypothetical protein
MVSVSFTHSALFLRQFVCPQSEIREYSKTVANWVAVLRFCRTGQPNGFDEVTGQSDVICDRVLGLWFIWGPHTPPFASLFARWRFIILFLSAARTYPWFCSVPVVNEIPSRNTPGDDSLDGWHSLTISKVLTDWR